MNKTAMLLFKWVAKIYDFQLNNRRISEAKSREYCREKWFEYGEKVIKKAIHQKDCTSIRKFELLCEQIKEHLEKSTKKGGS